VENYGGSVLSFAGDSISCWFEGDSGLDAVDTMDFDVTVQEIASQLSIAAGKAA
jgi:hypothetical protein